jgi:hypothetical protein
MALEQKTRRRRLFTIVWALWVFGALLLGTLYVLLFFPVWMGAMVLVFLWPPLTIFLFFMIQDARSRRDWRLDK